MTERDWTGVAGVVRAALSGHENGPVLTSLAATWGSVGPSPNEGQSRATPHAPQAGASGAGG